MKTLGTTAVAALGLALGMVTTETVKADTFGSGANQFDIDFVDIGNAGNSADTTGVPNPAGSVSYGYRMGTYEITQTAIDKATAGGMTHVTAGAYTGSKPAANITWYEAAAFVNWLNTSTGHQAAYNLSYSGYWSLTLWTSGEAWQGGGENRFRNKDAYYFLPSEDEWYKAAFYDPNKSGGAGYWDYATGSDTAPTPVASGTDPGTAVYSGQPGPTDTNNAGGLSPYGTMGQNGNVYEWTESASTPPNDSPTENRARRGGGYWFATGLSSSSSSAVDPNNESVSVGFRVASVPEPSAALLVLIAGVGGLMAWKRRRVAR